MTAATPDADKAPASLQSPARSNWAVFNVAAVLSAMILGLAWAACSDDDSPSDHNDAGRLDAASDVDSSQRGGLGQPCYDDGTCDDGLVCGEANLCITPTDPCQEVDCSGHGTCSVSNDEAVCACEEGYRAEGLTCIPDVPAIGDEGPDGRYLVWNEEFNEDELDMDTWTVGKGLHYLGREAYATGRPENLRVVDGHLEIIAIHEDYEDKHYTTSGITTKNAQYWQYGRFEARMWIPMATGCWPAFWLMPENAIYGPGPPRGNNWPRNGEIDIMEAISQYPQRVWGTIHYVENDEGAHVGGHMDYDPGLDDGYHIYSVVWTESEVIWYFDNEEYARADAGTPRDGILTFHQPFYILLNLALGQPWAESPVASEYPQTMLVDWVRVWQ
ncbi:MAG: glycoside hydrolase family 16 protein [Deltaproteobacteria bacterium]|nr:glycoside hydrolase family 16 protein [Deltaproteobacteria bacterium]